MSWLSSLFGGGSSGGGTGNLWGAILGGLGGAATAYLGGKGDEKSLKQGGIEQRKTLAFTAALDDYYNQKNKLRQRRALDTYGQFSMLDRYAPNYQAPAPLDQPQMPSV